MAFRSSIITAVAAVIVFGSDTTTRLRAQEAAAVDPALAAKGEWSATTTYAKDDIVTARGTAWISLKAGNKNKLPGQTSPSSAKWWEPFARGINPMGAWSNATKYQPDDLVTYLGQTWRAKLTNQNKQPVSGANWELLVVKGATGLTGATGPQGLQGATGPQGPPGPNTGVSRGTPFTPAISFSGDTDTGIYSPAPGKIALVENGTLFLHNLGSDNTGLGYGSLFSNTAGIQNTAVGEFALFENTEGYNNTALGLLALNENTSGSHNTAVGLAALSFNDTGNNNTAVGYNALGFSPITASNNIALGSNAGSFAGNPSNSIFIGNDGASGDTATIKIGTQGTQTSAFIAGVRGTTTGANNAVTVLVDSNGQLGTVSSSRRYKDDIATLADTHALLTKLRPVTFRYKKPFGDGTKPIQYGLIAEEVADVFPDLVVFNDKAEPETVKYHLLPTFLLAGWQGQQKTIAEQADEIAELKRRLAAIEEVLPRSKAAALH